MRNATLGFQFHIGSIQSLQQKARAFDATSVLIPHLFESKFLSYRSIRQKIQVSIPHWFDSKDARAASQSKTTVFQFHIGSIQSSYSVCSTCLLNDVSIPHWFDSKAVCNQI